MSAKKASRHIRRSSGAKPTKKTPRARVADPRWLGARRALLARYKRQAQALEGPEARSLKDYRERHARGLTGRWRASSKGELITALRSADVALGGDFHSLAQAQRAHLRVLRALPPEQRLTLALEAFSESAQAALDAFMRGALDADGLRKRSKWDREWGFPWEGYRALLELARARGWRALALSPKWGAARKSLRDRDAHAARAIVRGAASNPGSLTYVVFGELHLAPAHLPRAIESAARRVRGCKLRVVSVHLNSERIYFSLAASGLDAKVDVVRLSAAKYCLIATPPWVQWQAHWVHLHRSLDEGLGSSDDGYDYTDHVAELVRVAASDLGVGREIEGALGGLADVSVWSSEDAHVWRWLERRLPAQKRAEAAAMISEGRSFLLPREGAFYLARATLNHASELAGQYVHAKLSGRESPLWEMPAEFEAAVWRDAVGFFVSKLMNPQRRGETLADARSRLEALDPRDRGREALLLALDRRIAELVVAEEIGGGLAGNRRKKFTPRLRSSWREAVRILGAMMGERLYAALRSRSISLEGVVELLRMKVDTPRFAQDVYPELVRLLGHRFEPRDPKKERL